MSYIVTRTNLRSLRLDYYIGNGQFLMDVSFAKTFATKEECPYFERQIVTEKTLCGQILEKHLYSIVEK